MNLYYLKSCILCGKPVEWAINFRYKKFINNLNYEFIFDKEACFLQFRRLSSVYGESFELEAIYSREHCILAN